MRPCFWTAPTGVGGTPDFYSEKDTAIALSRGQSGAREAGAFCLSKRKCYTDEFLCVAANK